MYLLIYFAEKSKIIGKGQELQVLRNVVSNELGLGQGLNLGSRVGAQAQIAQGSVAAGVA